MKFISIICVIQLTWYYVSGYNILMLSTAGGRSHYILAVGIAKSLIEAGNDVTLISVFQEDIDMVGGKYSNIFLEGIVEQWFEAIQQVSDTGATSLMAPSPLDNFDFLVDAGILITNLTMEHSSFKKFLKSNEKFDVVIMEHINNDALKGLSCHFNAPLIGFSTGPPNALVNSAIGNPWPPSYVPDIFANLGYPMSIWERFRNTVTIIYRELSYHNIYVPKQNALMKKHFPHCPDLSTISYNVSLMFLNAHESFSQPMPYFPNMINIGGIHMKSEQTLPQDLQDFMDNATKGVIYFSMGTFLNASTVPSKVRQIILNVFAKTELQILWKWHEENIPGLSHNVKLGKWFPQQAILAHPNLKVFITHAGIGSIIEAVHYGVPIVTIPFFFDQFHNAIYAEYLGFAINIPFRNIEEHKLLSAVNAILNNSTYHQKAKERSRFFADRPMKPKDLIVYWTEFVIRTRGSTHLRVAAVDMPYYKYYLLDIIACLIISISAIFLCLYSIVKRLMINNKTKKD